MAKLILVRHAKSEWNEKGLWTGHADPPLSDEGREQAAETAGHLRDITIHSSYTSPLKRAKETLDIILKNLGISHTPQEHVGFKERDYGIFTGKNKWQVKDEVGEEQFQRIRRGWNEPIAEGETLQNVHDRVVPHFRRDILPKLAAGENVMIVAHGNSLRALVKHLESISDDAIADVEVGIGEVHIYEIDERGAVLGKEVRAEHNQRGKI